MADDDTIQAPNSPLVSSTTHVLGVNGNTGPVRQTISDLATQLGGAGALATRLSNLEQANGNSIVQDTWVHLSAITGTFLGEKAEVYGDGGTHTDPVVGGSVSNTGVYAWSVSPAGWKWLSADALSAKANIASPTLTGTPAAPTATPGTNTPQIATTAYVQTELGAKAPIDSPALTGNPTTPTQSSGNSSTKIASTAFVGGEIASKAVRFDTGQSLTVPQQAQARANIGAGAGDLSGVQAFSVPFRPGDTPDLFVSVLTGGEPDSLTPLSAVITASDGDVIRVTGSGIVATRSLFELEDTYSYRVRYVVRRRTNSSDPANDTVRLAVAWYDNTKARLNSPNDTTVLNDLNELVVTSGRTESYKDISRSALNLVTTAPTGAVYARPFVQTFGTDPVTDIEVIKVISLSDLPEFQVALNSLPMLEQEITDLQSQINVLNARLNADDSLLIGVVPLPVTLTKNLVAEGDSIVAGIPGPTTTATAWPGVVGSNTTGGTVTNRGVGGSLTSAILTNTNAESSPQKASSHVFNGGTNDITILGSLPSIAAIKSNVASIFTSVDHGDDCLYFLPHTGQRGTSGWVVVQQIKRWLDINYRGKWFNQIVLLQAAGNLSPTDQVDRILDRIPRSLRVDDDHPNDSGHRVIADFVLRWLRAKQPGGFPCLPPTQTIYLSLNASYNAQQLGAPVGQVAAFGTPTSFVILTGNEDKQFTIDASGQIWRSLTAFSNQPVYNLTVGVYPGGTTGTVTILYGAANTIPVNIRLNPGNRIEDPPGQVDGGGNRAYMLEPPISASYSTAISFFFRICPEDDSKTMYVTRNNLDSFDIIRGSGELNIFTSDGAGTVLCQLNSGGAGPTLTQANGDIWIFGSISHTGGGSATLFKDTVDCKLTPVAPVNGGHVPLNTPVTIWSNDTGDSGVNSFVGRRNCLWLAEGYIDWSIAANRNNVRDVSTKAPLDLGIDGTVNGLTPYLYDRGNVADCLAIDNANATTGGKVLVWVNAAGMSNV